MSFSKEEDRESLEQYPKKQMIHFALFLKTYAISLTSSHVCQENLLMGVSLRAYAIQIYIKDFHNFF